MCADEVNEDDDGQVLKRIGSVNLFNRSTIVLRLIRTPSIYTYYFPNKGRNRIFGQSVRFKSAPE